MSKANCLTHPLWANYPQLRHLATYMLTDLETENLLVVMLANKPMVMLQDRLNLASAMYWFETPQGHDYWQAIDDRISGLPMPKYDPPVDHGQTVGEPDAKATGWQPDIVNGASVMDITRSLF